MYPFTSAPGAKTRDQSGFSAEEGSYPDGWDAPDLEELPIDFDSIGDDGVTGEAAPPPPLTLPSWFR